MGRRLPAAAQGYLRRSKEAATDIPEGQATKPRLKVDELRALGLRTNWERVKDFPAMEENKRHVGLLAIVRKDIRERGLHCFHNAVAVGSDRGFPDLTIWGPGGLIFRELKGTTGELTVVQYEVIVSMREAGLDVAVWWPEDYHLGVIGNELDRLAGVAERERQPVLRPGYRRCGCHMDAGHACPTWGGYASILPR